MESCSPYQKLTFIGLCRALKVLGLSILNFYYSKSRGDSGRIIVLMIINGDKILLVFVCVWSYCLWEMW